MEKEMNYMYAPPKNKYEKDTPEKTDIVVEWKNGMAKGFRSREEAERYINHVCKKAAPDMNFSIYSDIIKR